MDSLFTININPDENVSIKKGKDNIKKYSKEGNDEEKSEEDDKLINFNINEISEDNTFEMLGDLNENQIKQFINVRKNIRKYILKSFKKDQIINGRLENSEIEFLCDENKKNNDQIKLILRKDIINNVINNFTKDKQKRNKANDMNNRYFYLNSDEKGYNNNDDDDNYNEEEVDEKNFMDLFMDTDMFEKKMNEENERIKEADINDDKKLELAIVISKNSDEDKISVKNDNRLIEEKCIVPKTFNKVLSNFEEIIKNWKLNFPDINTENLFFHLYFLSELYKEKRYICQNCGSVECEKDPFMKTKCLNNFCFLCHKHISENMCHNTRSQYASFKSHMSSFNDYRNIMYPYNYISCLSCFTRKHMKCGYPPYIFAKNTYCYRKDYSFKSNRPYVLYMNNPLYIWDISNDKKNRIVDSTKNDNDISVINIKGHKYNTLYNHDKISDIYSIDDYDSDYYDHDLSFKNENEKNNMYENEKNNMYENETFDNDIQRNKKKRKFSSYNLGNHNSDKMLNKKSRDEYNHDDIRKNFHYDNKHTNYRKEEGRNYSHKNKYNISYNNKYDNNINNKYNKHDENKQYTNDYLHSDDRNYVRNSVYEKKKNSIYMNNHNARNNNNDHYNLYNNNNNKNNKYNNQQGNTSGLYKYKKSSKNISHNHVPQNSFNNLSTTSNKNNNKHNSSHNYEKKYSWNPRENGQYKNNNNKKKPENNHRKASGLYKNVY
ncbi:hypothetical protein PFUGPA_04056 [Plasmodium falciparum Palo Alto/Uganda]|uniref:Uncharacterized protein n=2 Tax=Plasmodium falciparum TaxID=5833 RepID=W4IXV3_PLAFP|nr:hypothetical protein PFUGPA_04056 [Plasmodium falciparum Palo Alto/Uganda]ETW58496.1 hypothetical protein PFMC_05596 [Plasmodium falciparum CAMP/Malaysia]